MTATVEQPATIETSTPHYRLIQLIFELVKDKHLPPTLNLVQICQIRADVASNLIGYIEDARAEPVEYLRSIKIAKCIPQLNLLPEVDLEVSSTHSSDRPEFRLVNRVDARSKNGVNYPIVDFAPLTSVAIPIEVKAKLIADLGTLNLEKHELLKQLCGGDKLDVLVDVGIIERIAQVNTLLTQVSSAKTVDLQQELEKAFFCSYFLDALAEVILLEHALTTIHRGTKETRDQYIEATISKLLELVEESISADAKIATTIDQLQNHEYLVHLRRLLRELLDSARNAGKQAAIHSSAAAV